MLDKHVWEKAKLRVINQPFHDFTYVVFTTLKGNEYF